MLGVTMVETTNLPDAQGILGRTAALRAGDPRASIAGIGDALFPGQQDPAYLKELDYYLREFCGAHAAIFCRASHRPTWRGQDLLETETCCTRAHKINNAMGQILLARRMARPGSSPKPARASTGATATVSAMFGLKCVVYMGRWIANAKPERVSDEIVGGRGGLRQGGQQTLKEAINEAMRDWVTNVRTTHYLLGTAYGAHPYPLMVRNFQR